MVSQADPVSFSNPLMQPLKISRSLKTEFVHKHTVHNSSNLHVFIFFSCPKPPHRLAYSFEQKPAVCRGTSCDAAPHSPHGESLDEDEDRQEYHKDGHVLVKAWDRQCVHCKYFPKDNITISIIPPDTSSLWIPSLAAPRHLLHHGPH